MLSMLHALTLGLLDVGLAARFARQITMCQSRDQKEKAQQLLAAADEQQEWHKVVAIILNRHQAHG